MSGEIDTGYCTANARRRLLKVLAGAALAAPVTLASKAQAWELSRDKIIANSGGRDGLGGPRGGNTGNTGANPGGTGGTAASCMLAGTGIATDRGSVAIEHLAAGDNVETADGTYRQVKWVGRRTVHRPASGSWSRDQELIRIAANAIDDGMPAMDVLVTPAHGIYVGGFLINAGDLVNGQSVTREVARGETYTVYHVELDDHRVILANGLPVETLLVDECQSRGGFENAADYARLHGGEPRKVAIPYAPRVSYTGMREEIRGLLRASIYPFADLRDPIHRICDAVVARAARLG